MKLTDDNVARYLTKNADQVAGPCTMEGLESLVFLGRITPETLICPEGHSTYVPIKDTKFALVLFPLLHTKSTPENWGPPGQYARTNRAGRKHYKFTEAKFERVNQPSDASGKIEVGNILDGIRQAEIDSGRDSIPKFRFRISRRSRDFWLALIVGNGVLLGGILLMNNPISFVFGVGGAGLFTWGLFWSMYGVMDRY